MQVMHFMVSRGHALSEATPTPTHADLPRPHPPVQTCQGHTHPRRPVKATPTRIDLSRPHLHPPAQTCAPVHASAQIRAQMHTHLHTHIVGDICVVCRATCGAPRQVELACLLGP